MTRQITLFRGINVGGRNLLPMAILKDVLAELGCSDVQTYIQSGNAVFKHAAKDSRRLERKITDAVNIRCGFAPKVMILSSEEFAEAIKRNPFREIATEEKNMHFLFLDEVANDEAGSKISAALSPTESCELIGRVLYLFAPDGIARSKVAGNAEKYLGVPATARNLRTVNKLAAMAGV